jgi:hypothetical protein
MFRRMPRITDDVYGKLMTSFGRVVDLDRFVQGPAASLAERVLREEPGLAQALDAALYSGAAEYHLRLLAGAWIIAQEGNVPRETAEVFEEALRWRFSPLVKGSAFLPTRVGVLARGEAERDTQQDA